MIKQKNSHMFIKILLVGALALLLLRAIFELIISMIFSRDMSTMIIEFTEEGAEKNFPTSHTLQASRNPFLRTIHSGLYGIGREFMQIILYIFIMFIFVYIILVAIAPIILIACKLRW
jgi:small-conductance mechanosensitive channel